MTANHACLPLLLACICTASCVHVPSHTQSAGSPPKATKAQALKAAATGTPATETPATGTPATETPATETPATGTPATKSKTTPPLPQASPAKKAMARAKLILHHYHPRDGHAMHAFPMVAHLHAEPETSPVVLYAAYRQYQIAYRQLRAARVIIQRKMQGAPNQRCRDGLRRLHVRLLHALYVLRHDRTAAPPVVKRYWSYLAEVGEKLPGLH